MGCSIWRCPLRSGYLLTLRLNSTEDKYDPGSYGRKSVRLQSWDAFNHGLFVANFTHLPTPTCGAWPAFWMFGWPWPDLGEFDIMENWNSRDFNRNTAMINGSQATCVIKATDMSSEIESYNCDAYAPGQYWYQGCSSNNFNDTAFGSPTGGVYVFEWTDSHAEVWSWSHADVPRDLVEGQPSPSTWGTPSYAIVGCDMDKGWRDQRIVLNIGFCGVAGQDGTKPYTKNHWGECAASTGYDSCTAYVANNPKDFVDSHFLVKDIVVYRDASVDTEVVSENYYGGSSAPNSTSAANDSPARTTQAAKSSADGKLYLSWVRVLTVYMFNIALIVFALL